MSDLENLYDWGVELDFEEIAEVLLLIRCRKQVLKKLLEIAFVDYIEEATFPQHC